MIDAETPFAESPESVCSTHSVTLALLQPKWEPAIHSKFPKRFRDTTKFIVISLSILAKILGCWLCWPLQIRKGADMTVRLQDWEWMNVFLF